MFNLKILACVPFLYVASFSGSQDDGFQQQQQSVVGGGAPCVGCEGDSNAWAVLTTSPNCPDAALRIDVEVADGDCLTFSPPRSCHGDACSVTIDRAWSGLPPFTEMDFCRTVGNGSQAFCLDPKPNTNTGEGTDTNSTPVGIECGNTEFFSISHSCGIHAEIDASCSECK
jgi:hypothetical protein